MGALDTVGNMVILSIWPRHSSSSKFQMLHASFGIGTFLAPMLVKHALESNTQDASNNSTSSLAAFRWTALLVLPSVVMLWKLDASYKSLLSRHGEADNDEEAEEHLIQSSALSPFAYKAVVLASSFFFFLYVGLEIGFGAFIFSYGTSRGLSDVDGALLTSSYWGLFAVGRVAAIFLSQLLSSLFMTVSHLVAACCAALALLLDAHQHTASTSDLWHYTALFGLFMSSIFPSAFHCIDSYVSLDGRAASAIMVGAAAGEMFLPMLMGHLWDSHGPSSFPSVVFAAAVTMCVLFSVLWAYLQSKSRTTQRAHSTLAGIAEQMTKNI